VNTDLNIGAIDAGSHNEALKLTAEGVIKQKDGLTIDPDGRIISNKTLPASIGDLANNEHFVVDPAYTSTMNDIRLTSRGGVRLSDILPNYILKDQSNRICNMTTASAGPTPCGATISMPANTCPTGYNRALVVIPMVVNADTNTVDDEATYPAGILHWDDHRHTISKEDIANALTINGTDIEANNPGETISTNSTSPTANPFTVTVAWDSGNNRWQISGRYTTAVNSDITLLYQTYCVFEPSIYTTEATCEMAGFTWSAGSCTATANDTRLERTQPDCLKAGLTWDNNRCQAIYVSSNTITNYSGNISGSNPPETWDDSKKARACKLAGYTWSGNTCSN